MAAEFVLNTYLLGVLVILTIGFVFNGGDVDWKYYKGLLFMALLWPYTMYRGLRY